MIRVFVIDDDADSREVSAAFLRSSGFEVDEFESAEAALPRAHEASIIVTDITLPGMSGYEFAQRLRADARAKDVVLFAVSGRSDTTPEQARLFDRVIVKPFDPDALVQLLEQAAIGLGAPLAKTTPIPVAPPVRVAAEATAALRGDQYRIILEHSPVMVWRSGVDGKRDYVNATWLAFTGRTLEEELGDGWLDSVHRDDRERCHTIYREHFEQRTPFEVEYRLCRHDGVYRTVLARGVPYDDERGGFAGFIGSAIDVDERIQAERAKTTFLGMMAHELRTPLTPLRAYQVQMQRAHARGESVTEDLVKRFGRQVDRLIALVEHLGDAARLSANRPMMLAFEENDLSSIVRDTTARHKQTLAARRESKNAPVIEVSGTERERRVIGDRKRLEQMTSALIENAIKFSNGGTIRVSVSTHDGEHRLVVEDDGIGIPAAEIQHVGQPYFRASNAPADNYPGIGLGLAVAAEVAHAHGGTFEVASPRGAVITITLPERSDAPATGVRGSG